MVDVRIEKKNEIVNLLKDLDYLISLRTDYEELSIWKEEWYSEANQRYLEKIKICTGYKLADGSLVDVPPMAAEGYESVEPQYESVPGWTDNTFGVTTFEGLPTAAQAYIKRLEEITGVPMDIISTGPDRVETMILRSPFA